MRLGRGGRLATYLVIAGIGGGIALAGPAFWVQIAIGVAISAIVALAWDVLSRTGQVSLGTAAFFGIGAYATALLSPLVGVYLAWVGAVLVCALVAALFGFLTLRLRKMYFAIATLGFALAIQVCVLVFSDWTGGAAGIVPPVLADGDPRIQLLIITGFLVLTAIVSDVFLSPRFGPAFFMIRTNPELAAASGVPVVRSKVLAFIVSGVFAGIGGACYGGLYGYVVPGDVFTLNWSVLPLAIAILGGLDTTLGPLIGAVLLRALEELARAYIGGVGYQVMYGAVIIVFVMVMPTGFVGLVRAGRARLRRSRREPPEPRKASGPAS